MKCTIRNGVLALASLALSYASWSAEPPPAKAPPPPPLKKGDRIVFLGDSITQQGGSATGYVTLVRTALTERYKDLGLEVLGAGVSGNKVPDLQKRLQKDVLDRKPTVVVIYIGINDVWHWAMKKGTPKDAFEAGLKDLIARITPAAARVILCTPSVIGEKTGGGNAQDAMLEEYSEISRKVARETNTQLLDLRRAFAEYLGGHNKEAAGKGILTRDGVHLNEAGNRFVADLMLGALGAGEAR